MSDPPGTVSVLHVDDEPELADMAATFLEREDDRFVVDTRGGASEGLDYLAEHDVDCVISDHDMPGKNGIEFLEVVREDHPDLPFILYTGKGSEEVASEAISAGVTDYLQKESGTEQYTVLANRVANAVDQSRTEQELERTREYFRTILQGASDYVLVLDEHGRIDYVSPAIERVLGYSPDNLDGADAFDGIHPADVDDAAEMFSKLLENPDQEPTLEYRVQHADGSWRWLEVRARNLLDDPVISGVVVNVRDITDRKQSEHKLETTVGNLPGYVYRARYEPGWPLEFVKGSAEPITGYTTDELEEEMIRSDRLLHPADKSDVKEAAGSGLEAEGEFDLTYRIETKDGEARWVRDQAQLVKDPMTGDELVDGFVTDVTEQKERERTLAEIKDRYQAFVEGSSDIITVLNTDGIIEHQSPAIETVLGYDQAELVGDRVFEYVHPEDRDRILKAFNEAQKQPQSFTGVIEYRFKHADGSWVWVESVASSRVHSAVGGYVVNTREITERKKREQRLEALNRATRDLFTAETGEEVAEIGIEVAQDVIGLDANAVYLYDEDSSALRPAAMTDAARSLVGDPPTFTSGGSIAWRVYETGDPLAVDDVSEDPDVYDPETPIQSELFLPFGDHGILMAGSRAPNSFDHRDLVLGELLAVNIATALEQIGHREQIRAREAELRAQNNRLEEFTSIVSHDLRNPLSVAEGRLELLSEECESEQIDQIASAHDRMGTLLEDMLTLAREGRTVTEFGPVVLEETVEGCWSNVETENATLEADLDGTVQADEGRLKQVFENLIRNAVEHGSAESQSESPDKANDGGGTVTVRVGHLPDGFYVEDDGDGIPEADRDDVFGADYSTNDEGTGFGLRIAKQIVDAHGWDIRVADGSDGGARFEITGVTFCE